MVMTCWPGSLAVVKRPETDLVFCDSWAGVAHACPSTTAFPPAFLPCTWRDRNNRMETLTQRP